MSHRFHRYIDDKLRFFLRYFWKCTFKIPPNNINLCLQQSNLLKIVINIKRTICGICGICATNLRKDYSILWRANWDAEPSFVCATHKCWRDSPNANANPNDFRALKARLGAKASKNHNANTNANHNHNPNANLSENKNSRSWISRGGYWFVSDGCHATGDAQGGQNSRQNGDYRLNDVFPSFFFHGL